MPDIKVDDGCIIHVEVEGPERAPVLMLSNSLGTDLHMWDDQVAPLTRHFRLVRYDRRGHGKSDVPKGPYSMERLGRDVRRRARRARHRQDQLVRPVDGRHGRHVARRQCAQTASTSSSSPTRRAFSPTRPCGTAASSWCAKKASKASSTPIWSAGSPKASATARRRPSRDAEDVRRHQGRRLYRLRRSDPRHGPPAAIVENHRADSRDRRPARSRDARSKAGEFIKQHVPGARIAVLEAAHIANIEQPQAYADTVLGFLLN